MFVCIFLSFFFFLLFHLSQSSYQINKFYLWSSWLDWLSLSRKLFPTIFKKMIKRRCTFNLHCSVVSLLLGSSISMNTTTLNLTTRIVIEFSPLPLKAPCKGSGHCNKRDLDQPPWFATFNRHRLHSVTARGLGQDPPLCPATPLSAII